MESQLPERSFISSIIVSFLLINSSGSGISQILQIENICFLKFARQTKFQLLHRHMSLHWHIEEQFKI